MPGPLDALRPQPGRALRHSTVPSGREAEANSGSSETASRAGHADETTLPSLAREAVWHRRDVAAYWGVGLSTLDDWVAKGHVRLPAPRRDPGGKPYWIAGEVIDGAGASELAIHPEQQVRARALASRPVPVPPAMTDREAIDYLNGLAARDRG